jgi:hypothetical protein
LFSIASILPINTNQTFDLNNNGNQSSFLKKNLKGFKPGGPPFPAWPFLPSLASFPLEPLGPETFTRKMNKTI